MESVIASCSCGAVKISTKSRPLFQMVCHCDDCKRFTGSDYAPMALYQKEKVTVSGELLDNILVGGSGKLVTRQSCRECGTSILSSADVMPALIGVLAGTLNIGFNPKLHVFVSSKKDYVQIPEGVTQKPRGM